MCEANFVMLGDCVLWSGGMGLLVVVVSGDLSLWPLPSSGWRESSERGSCVSPWEWAV